MRAFFAHLVYSARSIMIEHQGYLHKALTLAKQREGFTAPNPAVGAVIVKNGEIIAEGSHPGPGEPHAEVIALQQAKEQAKGASVYVTLEPCCHYGRTPPCTQALIKHQVKEVFFAHRDPNPKVSGGGQKQLQQAGITCEQIDCDAIERFYEAYDFWTLNHLPWVTCKLAQSLDGKIALAHGEPTPITGDHANEYTHRQRLIHDAILTTAATVIADNPQLTVRLPQQSLVKKPVYVLDRTCRMSTGATITTTASLLTIFHGERYTPLGYDNDIAVSSLPEKNRRLCLQTALQRIAADGHHRLWVEAGSTLFKAMIEQQLAQRALLYISPRYLGQEAYSVSAQPWDRLSQYPSTWTQLGQDGVCEFNLRGQIS